MLQLNLLMTFDLPEEHAAHRRLLNDLWSRSLDDSTALYVAYIVFAVRGELEKAQALARDFRSRHPEYMASLGPHFARLLHYKCGELGDESFVADSRDSTFNLMEAHYFVGLAHLARKNREKAIEHLAAGEELGGNPVLRGILRRLRDHPDWPSASPQSNNSNIEDQPQPL